MLNAQVIRIVEQCIVNRGTIYWAGCGGCAAMADHATAELMGRLEKDRMPIASSSLSSNGALLTCIANDWTADVIYSRQVLIMSPNDIVFLLSTSGQSHSLIHAAEVAEKQHVAAISIAPQQSPLTKKCIASIYPDSTANPLAYAGRPHHMQEWMLSILHEICLITEEIFASARGRVVFTNGVFNILHAGHIYLLNRAAAMGDKLIVGIDGDDEVGKNKPDIPIIPAKFRAAAVQELPCVDKVCIFNSQEDLHGLIEAITPDILVKGPDYKDKQVVGQDIAKKVIVLEDSPYSTSSSLMLKHIRGTKET